MNPRCAKLVWAVLLLVWPSLVVADELDWLSTPTETTANATANPTRRQRPTRSMEQLPIRKVGSALAIVLGGFFLMSLLMRKQTSALAASEMMTPLGSVPIAPKVRLHLVKLGARILVLHISGQNVQRVAELTDAQEVDELLAGRRDPQAHALPISVRDYLQSVDQRTPQAERGSLG